MGTADWEIELSGPKRSLNVTFGQRFGRLRVLREVPGQPSPRQITKGHAGPRSAECLCDCDTTVVVTLARLTTGHTTSCGCFHKERVSISMSEMRTGKQPPNYSHGLSKHYLYATWAGMLARCSNPDYPTYKYYGGRGIFVHKPWHDVTVFISEIESLLGPRPEDQEIDRINNDGGYEPGNVRWATRKKQIENSTLSRDTETGQFVGGRQ